MRDWQPIETAKNGVSLLCYWPAVSRNDVKHEAYIAQAWKRFGNWFTTRDGYGAACGMVNDPTHWMPLPSPPAASDGEPAESRDIPEAPSEFNSVPAAREEAEKESIAEEDLLRVQAKVLQNMQDLRQQKPSSGEIEKQGE